MGKVNCQEKNILTCEITVKEWFKQKCSSELVLENENQKDSYIFWHRKVTLEVLCFDFVTFGQNIANFPLKLGNPCCHSKHPQTMKKKLGSLKENPYYRGKFLQI